MEPNHNIRFPGESSEYRKARNDLLTAEINLRAQVEAVAALRRRLSDGGRVVEDYIFEEGAPDLSDQETAIETRFSGLFEPGKDSLIVYSFMYGPDARNPCPMCTSLLDGLNGNAPHVRDRVNFVVVAKAPIRKIRDWARQRGWNKLRLLSSNKNTYNREYLGEDASGKQLPMMNVFRRTAEGIFHFYGTEMLVARHETGQDARHVDLMWPLWNLFDLTPDGRGMNWYPRFSYE